MPRKQTAAASTGENVIPTLQVTAQQSRFHSDATDGVPASKEILVKDLSISLGQRELLSHAELFLKEGGHYVLVGRNGVGKSTLLKAISEGAIPGIPWSLRVLLLGQTRELTAEELIGGLSITDETVLQHVIRSDRVRERLVREGEILSTAVETQGDSTAPVKAFRGISHVRLDVKLAEVRQIAVRRSGARGAKARRDLNKVEEEFAISLSRLEEDLSEIDPTVLSQETKAAVDMLTEVQSSLEMMNASAAEAKARTVLLGLGFPLSKIDDSTSKLSGGWRTRTNLACALCQTADILFLDEPSNFLDLPSIIWLQNYITTLTRTTIVVVTHDRDFADAVADELLVLRNQKVERFKGNLSLYESERIKKAKWMTDMKEAQDVQKKHMEKSVQNAIQSAKRTGDDKKLKQAASRQKKIDERLGMQVNAKGHRFKLNRDMGGFHNTSHAGFEIPDFDPPVRIKLPSLPPDLRFPGALVSAEKISYAYPTRKKEDILKEVSLTIHPGERVGICGLNGSGKTTLISLLVGSEEGKDSALSPTKGTITRHPRARFARFSQQVVEELEAFGAANREVTALAHLIESSNGVLVEKDARGVLGALGLQGRIASDVPIFALSGGQKVRLALAKLVYQPVSIFVLDEVTTHVDSDTILALVLALREYDGALLVVTHDRFFMRCVVEGEHPARLRRRPGMDDEEIDEESGDDNEEDPRKRGVVYRLVKGQLKVLERGMEQYEEICSRASAKLTKAT